MGSGLMDSSSPVVPEWILCSAPSMRLRSPSPRKSATGSGQSGQCARHEVVLETKPPDPRPSPLACHGNVRVPSFALVR
jgi:hypothetical protein